jgi:hypothetical protein
MLKTKATHLTRWIRIPITTLLAIVLLGSFAWVVNLASRPPRTNLQEKIFQGITYSRRAESSPRHLMLHIVEVDLTAPGIGILVTPKDERCKMDTCAMTTGEFVKQYGVQVAINGSFFEPFSAYDYTIMDYYPHTGDPVNILGLVISNGQAYSTADRRHANLCFTQGKAQIIQDACPPTTSQALAGGEILVQGGVAIDRSYDSGINPRSAAAVSQDGHTLWLIVVDGRQPGYSEGVTLNELSGMATRLGAAAALNLDGGGSSTLVASRDGPFLLNSPIHTRIPMRQRPVAVHLGIFALPE